MSGWINLHISGKIFHCQVIPYETVGNNSCAASPYTTTTEAGTILNTHTIKFPLINTDYRLLSYDTNQDSNNWAVSGCNHYIFT